MQDWTATMRCGAAKKKEGKDEKNIGKLIRKSPKKKSIYSRESRKNYKCFNLQSQPVITCSKLTIETLEQGG